MLLTKILMQIIGRDGVSRKRRGVKVIGGLVDKKYKYRSDKVFNTHAWMCYGLLPFSVLLPTLMYSEDEVEPLDVRGNNDFSVRTIKKSAEEFGDMLEDASFALYELLRKKNKSTENVVIALLVGILALNLMLLLGMLS